MSDPSTFHAAYARVVQRATSDPAFRAALIAEPHAAFAKETGFVIPADSRLRVIELAPGELPVILEAPAEASLSDDELELVVGGAGASTETFASKIKADHAKLLGNLFS